MRDVEVEAIGLIRFPCGEAKLELARADVDAVDHVALLELLDHQVLAAVLAVLRVAQVFRREHGRQLLERVAEVLGDACERVVQHVVAHGDADLLRALELELAQHELVEHLLLDDRPRRQLTALFGRLLLLLLTHVADDDPDAIRELALEHHAVIDHGGDALEQLAAGAELAVLSERARADRGRAEQRGSDENRGRCARPECP